MRAQIAQLDVRREVVADEVLARLGEEELTAVAGPQEARQAIQAWGEVIPVGGDRFPGVKRHPDAQG